MCVHMYVFVWMYVNGASFIKADNYVFVTWMCLAISTFKAVLSVVKSPTSALLGSLGSTVPDCCDH